METRLFADIIREVLVRDGVACLPGFGAFVTEEVPAYFSDKGFTVNPPYLRPVFTQSIKDDLTLVDFYASSNSVSRSTASSMIALQVQTLRSSLTALRVVLLPGLGYLRMTHDGNVFFVALEGLDIFPQYDLLEPVSLRYMPATFNSEPVPAAEEQTLSDPQSDAPVATVVDADTAVEPEPALAGPEEAVVPTVETPSETPSEESSVNTPSRRKPVFVFFISLVIAAVLFFAALAILGRVCPQVIDPLLYNARELEIVKLIG